MRNTLTNALVIALLLGLLISPISCTPRPTPTPMPSMLTPITCYPVQDSTGNLTTLCEYDESDVLGQLRNSSKAFNDFYQAQRGNLPAKIHWLEDPSLPDNQAYTRPESNSTFLKQIPPSPGEDFVIAHEMCAYIMSARGFRVTEPTATASASGGGLIYSYLNEIVATPLRDSYLTAYGFDMEQAYRRYLGDFLSGPHPPSDLAEKFRYLFFYGEMVLYWEDVLHKTGTSDFQQKFDEWYPDLAEDGHSLILKIRTVCYDTPDKMAALFSNIIADCNLYEIVEFRP